MKKTITTIIIMAILIVSLGSYVIADKVKEHESLENQEYLNYGYQQGQMEFYNSLLQGLSTEGYVIIPVKQDNQTYNVKLVIDNTNGGNTQ